MGNNPDENSYQRNRRSFLKYAGVAGTAVLAGCLGDDDDTADDTADPGDTDDDGADDDGADDAPDFDDDDDETDPDDPQEGGTLRVGFNDDPDGMDPYAVSEATAWITVYNICESLLTYEDGEVAGRLAESYDVDDNVYTFQLKEGVQFHGGYGEFTAEDVVYSFDRLAEEDSVLASDVAIVEDVRAIDDYEVEVELEETFGPFIAFITRPHWVMLSEEAVEDQGGEIGDFQEPIGTGPFEFVDYVPDDRIELAAFDEYHGDSAYVDEVEMLITPDQDSRVLALESGDVDFARNVSPSDAERLDEQEDTKVAQDQASAWAMVHINSDREPWDNPAVRQAVAHVIDRQAIVDVALEGFGEPSAQFFPEENFWYHEDLENERLRDLEEAQRILDEAGNPLEDEVLELKTSSDFPIMQTTAEILQANLAEIGVEAEINNQEFTTHVTDYIEFNYGALAFSEPFEVDPDRHYWNSLMDPGYNRYTDDQPEAERLRELLQDARSMGDEESRKELYREAEEIVQEYQPWISVCLSDNLHGMRSNVHGFDSWTLPYDRYWTMWKDEE